MATVSKTQVVKFIRKGEKGDPGADGVSTIVLIFSSVKSYPKSSWETWKTGSRQWTEVTNIVSDGIKVGDTVIIEGVVSDYSNMKVTMYATVDSIDSTTTLHSTTKSTKYSSITGAALRGPQKWEGCATGYSFQAGGEGDEYKDVVLYGGNYYSCKKNHTKTSTNYPGSTADTNNGYWRLGDKVELIAAHIILAGYELVKNLGAEVIEMKDSGGNIIFQAKDGNVTCKTGTFDNITSDNGTFNNATINGNLTANSLRLKAVVNGGFLTTGAIIRNGGNYIAPQLSEGEVVQVIFLTDLSTRSTGTFTVARQNSNVVFYNISNSGLESTVTSWDITNGSGMLIGYGVSSSQTRWYKLYFA